MSLSEMKCQGLIGKTLSLEHIAHGMDCCLSIGILMKEFGFSKLAGAALAMIVSLLMLTVPMPLALAAGNTAPGVPGAGVTHPSAVAPQAPAAKAVLPVVSGSGVNFVLSSYLSTLSSLTITPGSTYVVDVGRSQGVTTLRGDVVNNGQLYFVSSNPAIHNIVFSAANLTNASGSVLGTRLLSTASSTLSANEIAAVGTLMANLNLSITARSVTNLGTIASSGSLSIATTNGFTNGGTLMSSQALSVNSGTAIVNTGAIGAVQDVNLWVGSGSLANSGQIISASGNINVATSQTQNLIINNLSGSMQATSGAINFRDVLYAGSASTSISGGALNAQVVNFNGGGGQLSANVDTISGTVNTVADTAHVSTNGDTLTLGNIMQTGDPTYFNDSGNIVITGNISVGENLVLISSQNILTSGPNVNFIQARNATGQAFDITMIAGANVTGSALGPAPSGITASQASSASFTGRLALVATLTLPVVRHHCR